MLVAARGLVVPARQGRVSLTKDARAGRAGASVVASGERTRRLLERIDVENDGGGAGRAGSYEGLRRLDAMWAALRTDAAVVPPAFCRRHDGPSPAGDDKSYDVAVLGGTLGIFVAAALQHRGLRCVVVERAALVGRKQEWNLSLDEVQALVDAGALDAADVDGAVRKPAQNEVVRSEDPAALVASHFGSVRAGFNDGEFAASGSGDARLQEIWLPEVLNVGVRPDVAVARARAKFERAGGVVLEETACAGVDVFDDAAVLDIAGPSSKVVKARLVVDAMGNGSPVARQGRAARNGGVLPKPSGVCCVVGTLARGYGADNSFGDLIYTNEPSTADRQNFWEAFPAAKAVDARTTYLFTYLDADAGRTHSVEAQFEDYWRLLPSYQRHNADCFQGARGDADAGEAALVDAAVESGALTLDRALYGLFPTYRDSPLPSQFDRVVAVGDASGIQSPLSFGGFGALTRHLDRVAGAVEDALAADALTKSDLSRLNPYLPNLSVTWMFQKSFVVPTTNRDRPPNFVNRLMRQNYDNMRTLGDDVLRPFNQDVVQPLALLRILGLATLKDPLNIPVLLYYVGPKELLEWMGHFAMMALYAAAHATLGAPTRALADSLPQQKGAFRLRRLAEAWEFGSGADYRH